MTPCESSTAKRLPCGLEELEYPILASQLPIRQADPQTPEKRLWAAVLKEAVQCLKGEATISSGLTPFEYRAGMTNGEKRRRRQLEERRRAREWFKLDTGEPHSYQWVCWSLGLDAEGIREGLRQRGLL